MPDLTLCTDNAAMIAMVPRLVYCTDNAAMIGVAAYPLYLQKSFSDFKLNAYSHADIC